MNPFKVGKVFKILKDEENLNDEEAIRAELLMIGTIGYVANSVNTVFAVTVSAGRLYEKSTITPTHRLCLLLIQALSLLFFRLKRSKEITHQPSKKKMQARNCLKQRIKSVFGVKHEKAI